MPSPKSPKIEVSLRQKTILEKIKKTKTASYRDVSRAELILLIDSGLPNTQIAKKLNYSIPTVRHWRLKWIKFTPDFLECERVFSDDKKLTGMIFDCLKDAIRPGTPSKYNSKDYCEIMALALEDPAKSDRPITDWTARELADECSKRGIAKGISIRQIGRFLKRSGLKTT